MWNTVFKIAAQVFIAKFLRNRMQDAQESFTTNAQGHFSTVKKNIAALLESHVVLFRQQLNQDTKRAAKSLVGFVIIFFALLISLFTGLLWLIATAWESANRDIILGVTMVIPILLSIGIFFAIRNSWKKQPLLSKSIVQIEKDWQVFRGGLDGTADISDEANR